MVQQLRHNLFTLIELLIVVAIISILASMLLPMLSRAKRTTQRIACAGQQRQVGLALVMYSDEYDSFYPPGSPRGGAINDRPWDSVIGTYLAVNLTDEEISSETLHRKTPGSKILRCPSQIVEPVDPRSAGDAFARTYTLNGWECYFAGTDTTDWGVISRYRSRRTNEISQPSSTIISSEYENKFNTMGIDWFSVVPGIAGHMWFVNDYSFLHGGNRVNFGYVDGHVEFKRKSESFKDDYDNWKAIRRR